MQNGKAFILQVEKDKGITLEDDKVLEIIAKRIQKKKKILFVDYQKVEEKT